MNAVPFIIVYYNHTIAILLNYEIAVLWKFFIIYYMFTDPTSCSYDSAAACLCTATAADVSRSTYVSSVIFLLY